MHRPWSGLASRRMSLAAAVAADEPEISRKWKSITGAAKLPALVSNVVKHLKDESVAQQLESTGARIKFLPEEDRRHRAAYKSIDDPEDKARYFAARQVACRLVGSVGYLCEQCWIPSEDCICHKIPKGSLWPGVKLWLYMHPKDFMRKNNTGKLLWHTLGTSAASLCVCGVQEQEQAMWSVLERAGNERVWCLFPEKSRQVGEISIAESVNRVGEDCTLHFVLMDGTWSNSKAMLSRMNLGAQNAWGVSHVQCLALSPEAPSAMHDLRPQPSTQRTCTAAAASQLLRELGARPELAGVGLEASAETIDASIKCLFDALASRRSRVGRPICRLGRREVSKQFCGSAA